MDTSIEQIIKELTPQVVASVVRRFHDFAAAEDAVQEASIAALIEWPKTGLPDSPRAWVTRVAYRRMTDQIRSDSARRHREEAVAQDARLEASYKPGLESLGDSSEQDDTLLLLFMCCHPALTRASAIALTLRAVGGLTTTEIAHAFLVPEKTMAQRISRAKQTIKNSGIPFDIPGAEERAERLRSVLHILYLIFNEGYTSSHGAKLQRADLSHEAIRLARIVHQLQPNDTEATGLLALILLTDARRNARSGPNGELIPLAEQDRTVWDRDRISEGIALLSATLPKGSVGPYQLQAAIAALHDEAECVEDTDWPQILVLYGLLRRMSDSPMVALNHAIAVAMVHGPAKGLQILDSLLAEGSLEVNHRLDATRAHLLELAGQHTEAIGLYRSAAGKTASLPERTYLLTQAARLAGGQC